MKEYLGEFDVNIEESPFKDYGKTDWAMYYIERYGQIDGSHHKTWVLDQCVRIMKGTPVIVKLARWDNGKEEYRVTLGEPSVRYNSWVEEMLGEYDEECDEYEYSYDIGCPP